MDEVSKHPELLAGVRSELERAAALDDTDRLKTLEDLYRSLENELEGDPDQAGQTRH